MKSLKRKLAVILAVSMILTGVVPAYAAVNDAEGIAIEEDMRISEGSTGEMVGDADSFSVIEASEEIYEAAIDEISEADITASDEIYAEETEAAEDPENEVEKLLGEAPDVYLDYDEASKTFTEKPIPAEATTLNSNLKKWGSGWYVLDSNVSIGSRIQVEGTVNLILKDTFKLTAPKGIRVKYGTTLNIYSGINGTGALYVSGPDYTNSGIGGDGGNGRSNPDEQCGNITIDGGIIEARGGEGGAGIGAGGILSPACHENKGTITINGGHIKAIGSENGAGIGGGDRNNSGTITINGGHVEAFVNNYRNYAANAAGIGGGYQSISNKITITGGTVIAVGAGYSAGIGGGYQGGTGTIDISGGEIHATAGKDGSAAIGSAVINNGGVVNISGGTIYAEAFYESGRNGAVIGGGCSYTGGGCKVNISGGRIDAVAHYGVGKAIGNGTVTVEPDGKLIYVQKEFGNPYEGSPFSKTTVLKNSGSEIHMWELEKCTITWVIDGVKEPVLATRGEMPHHDDPVKPGYVFSRWDPAVEIVDGDATYTAVFDAVEQGKIAVSFDTDGGSWINPQIIASGSCAERPETDPEKKGYSFAGWYKDQDRLEEFIFTETLTEDTRIYAKWIPENYEVSFDVNYDGGSVSPATISVCFASPYGAMPKPSREEFVFDGWYTERSGGIYIASTSVCTKTSDHILYAHWIEQPKPQYIVSFNTNGGSYIDAQTVAQGASPSRPLSDPVKTGYSFAGWYADEDLQQEFDFNAPVNNTTIIYAGWSINEYTIKWFGGLDGKTLITTTTEEYNSYPEFPNSEKEKLKIEGYAFSGWDRDFTAVTQDTSYTAMFEAKAPEYCYVTFRTVTDKSINNVIRSVKKGNDILLPDSSFKPGYRFDGWYDNAAYEGQSYTDKYGPVNEDITLFARYVPRDYTIKWMNDETLLASESYAYGTRPSYKGNKPEKAGAVFVGWTPEISEVRGNTTYRAIFQNKSDGQCVVSFDSCGGTPVNAKTVDSGQQVEQPDPQPGRNGYDFAGWYRDAEYTSWFSFDEIITEDIILYAKWNPKEYVITWVVNGEEENRPEKFGFMPDYGSIPVKPDCIFTGWSPALSPVEGPAIYTAQFKELSKAMYLVDFDTCGGSHIPAQKISSGEKAVRPSSNPSRTNYTFTGWFEDAGNTKIFDFNKPVTSDLTVYAGWKYSGSHSGGGGGGSSQKTAVPAGSVTGNWSYNAATGNWNFSANGVSYANRWAYVYNPMAGANQSPASWFYFDVFGNMLTGWQWIKGADGITRCYYLNPFPDGTLGACQLGGVTPDGYTLDASGAWTVNGVVQTR